MITKYYMTELARRVINMSCIYYDNERINEDLDNDLYVKVLKDRR